MRIHSRTSSCLAVGAAGLMVMAACGSSSKKSTGSGTTGTTAGTSKYPPIPAGPIKLGVSTPLTGATAAFGTTTKTAFENVTTKTVNAAHPDGIDRQLTITDREPERHAQCPEDGGTPCHGREDGVHHPRRHRCLHGGRPAEGRQRRSAVHDCWLRIRADLAGHPGRQLEPQDPHRRR